LSYASFRAGEPRARLSLRDAKRRRKFLPHLEKYITDARDAHPAPAALSQTRVGVSRSHNTQVDAAPGSPTTGLCRWVGTAGAAALKTAKQDKVALVFAEKSLLQCADNYSRSAHNRSIVGFQPASALGESLTTDR